MNKIFGRIVSFARGQPFFTKLTVHRKGCFSTSQFRYDDTFLIEEERDLLLEKEYLDISNKYLNIIAKGHRTAVIQPYIKWGHAKKQNTNKDLQLAEACALVESLPYWTVVDKMCISLRNFNHIELFGAGNIDMLRQRINSGDNISAIFISVNTLHHTQILRLEKIFNLPVYDRYSLVIHIFKSHAKSTEAKIQVAIAELPYIYQKLSEVNGRINLLETRKLYLHAREAKLKAALEKVRKQRELIRTKRKKREIPTVAIVGYTNAGKTSLIKALTKNKVLQPRNFLFATLDTTAYEGFLPCKMRVLYIDTIGFIQDVPEELLAPFHATLEDAMFADVIIHLYDASHPDREAQVDYVRKTLASIIDNNTQLIEVANKCDLIELDTLPGDTFGISATKLTGVDVLRHNIEELILSRTSRSVTKMRVASGSEPYYWLRKETTVLNVEVDPNDSQFLILDVVTTEKFIHRFRKFLRENSKIETSM